MQKKYKADIADGRDLRKEYGLPSGKRIDFIDIENKTIYELKPNNPVQIRKGKTHDCIHYSDIEPSIFLKKV